MANRHLRSAVMRLHQKPHEKLCSIVHEGVTALLTNAEELLRDSDLATAAGRNRMSHVADILAREELAKIDILWEAALDPTRRSLALYYKHLERLIYFVIQDPGYSFGDYAEIQCPPSRNLS